MSYSAEISRANPACFLFLIIQCARDVLRYARTTGAD